MEQLVLRRILNGDERLYFLVNKQLFVNPMAHKLLEQIGKFYQEYLTFPTVNELLFKNESQDLGFYIEKVMQHPMDEALSAEFLAHELKNQSARNLFIDSMLELTDNLHDSSYDDISENLYSTSLQVRELSEASETIFNPANLPITAPGDLVRRLPSGLDKFDEINGGFAPGELVLIGGRRGTGKSIFALNVLLNYFHKYDFSVIFFSIEMPKNQVNNRLTSIISGVPNSKIVRGLLTDEDKKQILRAKVVEFFDSTHDSCQEFLQKLNSEDADPVRLEGELKYLPLKDKQFFIVDDVNLSISKIDYYLSLLKQKSKAPIYASVVDYLNILNDPEAKSDTDWQVQNSMSKRLKILGRLHEMIMMSPYQIDQMGKARFATAIEDHIDCALKFLPSVGQRKAGILPVYIDKMRDGRDDFEFQLIIDKDTLALKNLDEQVSVPEDEEDVDG